MKKNNKTKIKQTFDMPIIKNSKCFEFTILSINKSFYEKRKKVEKSYKKVIFIILASTLIGFTNGFFGGGGGMLCVPLLEKSLNISNKRAHATTIAVIVPLSLVSSIVYFLKNDLNVFDLLYTSIGVFIGGALGAVLLKKFSGKVIRVIFALLMLIAEIKMVI